jgi:hypothetical protein
LIGLAARAGREQTGAADRLQVAIGRGLNELEGYCV